jgi:TonB family protein
MTTQMWHRLAPTAKFTVLTLVALTLTFCSATFVRAQDAAESHRKVVTRVAPEYPSMGRMLNLRGSVKLEAVVSPNGTVKTAEVKGGHPVLAQAALNAVYKWKWEPAAKESHESIVVQFNPE